MRSIKELERKRLHSWPECHSRNVEQSSVINDNIHLPETVIIASLVFCSFHLFQVKTEILFQLKSLEIMDHKLMKMRAMLM